MVSSFHYLHIAAIKVNSKCFLLSVVMCKLGISIRGAPFCSVILETLNYIYVFPV